jgi:hypothetical protein
LPQGSFASYDKGDPLGGVDAEGIRGEIVDEPDEGDDGLERS